MSDPFYLRNAPTWYRAAFAIVFWVTVLECLGLIVWCLWLAFTTGGHR